LYQTAFCNFYRDLSIISLGRHLLIAAFFCFNPYQRFFHSMVPHEWIFYPRLRSSHELVKLAHLVYAIVGILVSVSLIWQFCAQCRPDLPGLFESRPEEENDKHYQDDAARQASLDKASTYMTQLGKQPRISANAMGVPLTKPLGMHLVAVVFYGRRDRASILECYLRKNLVSNGGWVDQVVWVVNTEVKEDRSYANEIAKAATEYKVLPIIGEPGAPNYDQIWSQAFADEEAVYVKIDDDVIFMDDNAIPRLVTTLTSHPVALLVSSNVVNNPALGWLHYHMGAVHGYIPEVTPQQNYLATTENGVWRASGLPHGNDVEWKMPEISEFYKAFGVESPHSIPKHRWFPVHASNHRMITPAAFSQYDPMGNNLVHWALAAQAHYSLLQNIEENGLDRYFMMHGIKRPSGLQSTWDMTGTRISINFIAIRGRDVFDYRSLIAVEDDEQALTLDIPSAMNRSESATTFSLS
jgi:hypothetical protein